MPNPQQPSGISFTDSDQNRDKEHKEKLKDKFEMFYKANKEFNSADSNNR